MQHRAAFWILLSLAALLGLWAAPATAGMDSWYFGGGFSVGGVHFRVGYAEAGPFGSSFYFEAAKPFHYGGYGCSAYCYRQGPRFYHHPSCSLVHQHFSRHGYAPGYYLEHYGPRIPYPPPVHYYAPPRWNARFYGSYGSYDRYYRDRHGYKHKYKQGRGHRYRDDRRYYDRRYYDRRHYDRRGNDRGRQHQHDRDRDRRDRHNGGRFDRD